MYQDRIEYLKRTIKRTYKQYTGERTDGKATLTEVAKFFNIPIDETRLEDYVIRNIDFKELSIEIYDSKTITSYTANYTCNADLLNTYGGGIRFNRLKLDNPLAKVDSIYYIGGNTPLKSQMTFTCGEYELVFETENPHGEFFSNNDVKSTVRYSKSVDYEDRKVQATLLTRVFKRHFKEETISNIFEHLFTYDLGHYIQRDDMQDKYTYSFADNVIYGVQEHDERQSKKHIRGICFQSTNVKTSNYLPYNIRESDYPMLKDNNLSSAIIFKGSTGSTEDHRDRENLEIYKNNNGIHIKYHVNRHFRELGVDHKPILEQVISLPLQAIGKLTLEELQSIAELLKLRFASDEFIALILQELQVFDEKIRINEGLVQEVFDVLSPKLLIDKSFAEIYEEVTPNLDTYFNLAEKQFRNATNIDKPEEKGQVKVLKSNNNLQNSEN